MGAQGPLWGRGGEEGNWCLSSLLISYLPSPFSSLRATRLLLLELVSGHDDASKEARIRNRIRTGTALPRNRVTSFFTSTGDGCCFVVTKTFRLVLVCERAGDLSTSGHCSPSKETNLDSAAMPDTERDISVCSTLISPNLLQIFSLWLVVRRNVARHGGKS